MPEVLSEKIEKFEKFSNATEIDNTNNTNDRKSYTIMDANENEKQKTNHNDTCSSSRSSSSRSRSSSSSMNGATFIPKARQDHYNPSVRLLKIDKSTNGACGFHLTRSKWDPYPWVSAVDSETPAELSGLKAGDCVLEVNGEDVLGLRITDIADLAKRTPENVTLMLWSSGIDPSCDAQSLCCGPMPTSLRRLSIIVQNILSIIECPVCLDTISPPAMQCQNGHLLCVNCRIRAEKCPVCRDRYTPRRALIAEQIYTAITNAFNLCSNEDKLRLKLFGPNAKKPEPTAKMPEEKGTKGKKCHSRARSTATTPTLMPRNKLLAKLMGKAYSMDNIASSCSMSNNGHGLMAATSTPTLGVMMTKALTTTTMTTTMESTSSPATNTPIAATIIGIQPKTNQLHDTNRVRNHLLLDGFTTEVTNVIPATNVLHKHLSLSTNNLPQDSDQAIVPYYCSTLQYFPFDSVSSEDIGKSLSPIVLDKRQPSILLNDSVECLSVARLQRNSSSSSPLPASLITATTSDSCGISSNSATSNDSNIKNELLLLYSSEEPTVLAAATTPSSSISFSVVLSTSPSSSSAMSVQAADLPVAASSTPSTVTLENTQSQTNNPPLESFDCTRNSFSMRKLKQETNFRCPCNCGKIFNASSKLQRHVKVDHQMPILSFGASSAKLALPLQQPLDNAVLVLDISEDEEDKYKDVGAAYADNDDETVKNDDKRCIKECWIILRATKDYDFNGRNRSILLTTLLQGSENEYSDFILEIQVSGHPEADVGNLMKSNAAKKTEENAVRNYDNVADGNASEVKSKQQQQMARSIDVNLMEANTWNENFDSINQYNTNKNNINSIGNKKKCDDNNKKNEFISCLSGNVESYGKNDFHVIKTICPTTPPTTAVDSGGRHVNGLQDGGVINEAAEILLNIDVQRINKNGR